MPLRHNPFPFIFTHGNALTRLACLAAFKLQHIPAANECINRLRSSQFPDGSYPSSLDHTKWGMRETIRNTLMLLNVGIAPDDEVIRKACEFILSHQNQDGGWCENPEILIPKRMLELSNAEGVTWISADVVDLLLQAGMEGSDHFQKAINWLRDMQNQYGGWPCFSGDVLEGMGSKGDPDSTAKITFLLGEIVGKDDPAYIKGREIFEFFLDSYAGDVKQGYWTRLVDGKKEPLDAYHLTHLFLSSLVDSPRRFQSGYDLNESRVRLIMEALIHIQQDDGGWRPFWEERSSSSYSVLAIKVLVLSGFLVRESLEIDIRSYSAWQNICKLFDIEEKD